MVYFIVPLFYISIEERLFMDVIIVWDTSIQFFIWYWCINGWL